MPDDISKKSLDELRHHGVKGQKWGVTHDKPSGGSSSGSSKPQSQEEKARAYAKRIGVNTKSTKPEEKTEVSKPLASKALTNEQKAQAYAKSIGVNTGATKNLSPKEKQIVADLESKGVTSDSLKAKYGPPGVSSPKKAELTVEQKSKLTPGQKKALEYVGVAAIVGGLAYYEHKQDAANAFFKDYSTIKNAQGLRFDPSKLSTTDIHYPKGHIFKRISTVAENEIRDGGFFAAGNEEDVARYKAILPVYWKQWGLKAESGYVVNLRAKTEIKAPSERAVYDYFRKSLEDSNVADAWSLYSPAHAYGSNFSSKDLDDIAKNTFHTFVGSWVDDTSKSTTAFFKFVKDSGYNSVIDMNDAGALSKQPMRILDGTNFEIAGHDVLSKEAIKEAQNKINTSLKHDGLTVDLFALRYQATTPLRGGD